MKKNGSCVQVERLPVFWKQRRMMFFDAFSFAFPAALQRIPYSLFVSLIWTVVTYFPVGLAEEPSRYNWTWRLHLPCYAQLCLPALLETQSHVVFSSNGLCIIL